MGFLDKLFGRDKKDEIVETSATEELPDDLQPHGSLEDDASDLTHDEERLDDVRKNTLRKSGWGN